MDEVMSIGERIQKLRDEGLSLRMVAKTLNISLGKVQRLISSTGNQGVSIQPKSVSDNVSECIDTVPNKEPLLHKKSVADPDIKRNTLIQTININIQKLNKRIKTLENTNNNIQAIEEKINNMEQDFNTRVNSFIGNALESRLEGIQEHIINSCREELKRG